MLCAQGGERLPFHHNIGRQLISLMTGRVPIGVFWSFNSSMLTIRSIGIVPAYPHQLTQIFLTFGGKTQADYADRATAAS
jgi:hypothetical protein